MGTEKTAVLLVGLFKNIHGHFPYQDSFTKYKTSYINNLMHYKKQVVVPNNADVFMFIDYDGVILTKENKLVVIANIKKIFGKYLKEIIIYKDNPDFYNRLNIDFRENIFNNFKNNFDSINFKYTDDDIRNSHLFKTNNLNYFYKLYIANMIKSEYAIKHNINYKYLLSDRLDSTTYYKEIIIKDIVDNLLKVHKKVICGACDILFAGLNSELSNFFNALKNIGKYPITKKATENLMLIRPSYICGFAETVICELIKYVGAYNCNFDRTDTFSWPTNFCGQRCSKENFGRELYSEEDWNFLTKEIKQIDFDKYNLN